MAPAGGHPKPEWLLASGRCRSDGRERFKVRDLHITCVYSIYSLSYTVVYAEKRSTNLIVGPEASLTGESPSRSGSTGGSAHSSVRGSQTESVTVGGETNQQLLSGGTVALPVVHGVVLHIGENTGWHECPFCNNICINLQQEHSLTTLK